MKKNNHLEIPVNRRTKILFPTFFSGKEDCVFIYQKMERTVSFIFSKNSMQKQSLKI